MALDTLIDNASSFEMLGLKRSFLSGKFIFMVYNIEIRILINFLKNKLADL